MKYIKKFEKFDEDVLNKDIVVYRSENKRKAKYVNGNIYFATTKQATQFGTTIFYTTINKGKRVLDLDNNNLPVEVLKTPKKLSQYIIDNEYYATKKGDEYAIMSNTKDSFLFKHGWSDNFDYVAGEPCWTFTNTNNREIFWIISPVNNEYDIDAEYEPYKNKYILFDIDKSEMMKSFDSDTEALEWFNHNILN
jgi:hypothetical protein